MGLLQFDFFILRSKGSMDDDLSVLLGDKNSHFIQQRITRRFGTSRAVTMFSYTNFHDVFPTEVHLPYDRRLQHDIEAHRKNAEGVLFIDRVMRALGISKG